MKKKTTLQKATFFFLSFFMLCGMFIPTQDGNMVYAAELQSNVITGASITDLSNQPITNPIGAWKPFKISTMPTPGAQRAARSAAAAYTSPQSAGKLNNDPGPEKLSSPSPASAHDKRWTSYTTASS